MFRSGYRLALHHRKGTWQYPSLSARRAARFGDYERRANNPSVEFVRQAARTLGVSMTELLGEDVQIKRARKTGPTGKVHKIFEEVSKLPRRQQEKIVEVVSALVSQYAQTRQ